MSDVSRPTAWRTAALFGDEASHDPAVALLYDLPCRPPGRRAMLGGRAHELYGASLTMLHRAPWSWSVLSVNGDTEGARPSGALLTATAVDVACAVHPARAPWTEAHARWWGDVRDADVRSRFVLLDAPAAEAEDIERSLRVSLCALGLPGDDVVFVAGDLAAPRQAAVDALAALVAAWDAAPVAHPPRADRSPVFGRSLHCAACERPVTAPVLVATTPENARVWLSQAMASTSARPKWFVAPGLCIEDHPEALRRDCWHVEMGPPAYPVLRCACGRELGHRWWPRRSERGAADVATWTVAAFDKAAVRFG